MTTTYKFSLATIVSLVVLLGFTQAVNAGSVVWSTTENVYLSPGYAGHWVVGGSRAWLIPLRDVGISTQYRAGARTAEGVEACGGPVQRGDKIILEFGMNDVSWFGTGGSFDTPEGYWNPNAEGPKPQCSENDRVYKYTKSSTWGQASFYTPFVANPPKESISWNSEYLDCTPISGGNVTEGPLECVVLKVGTTDVLFSFGSTYGKFYFHNWHSGGGSSAPWSGGAACSDTLPPDPNQYYQVFLFPYSKAMEQVPPQYVTCHDTADYGKLCVAYFTNAPTEITPQPFQVDIPTQSITCPITVVPATDGPSAPVVSAEFAPSARRTRYRSPQLIPMATSSSMALIGMRMALSTSLSPRAAM